MADIEKEVRVAFEGDDRLSKTIEGMNTKLQGFSSSVADVTQPLANLTDKVLLFEAALAALAVGGLAYATAKAFEFESAEIELQKVLGDQPEILEVARQKALELSSQYGQSAADILVSTADFKQAGFSVEESFTLTKAAMDLVIAGSVEASEASEILIRILKGFGEGGDEANRVLDILNETSNNYAVSVEQLGEGMARLSPVASQMGFTFEETAGLLTPVIEVFQSGDEAANALRTGLLRLVDDNPTVVGALEAIGVAQRDQNDQLRPAKDILLDVQEAFGNLTEEEKLYYTQQLTGIQQASKMVVVFDDLERTTNVTATAMNSAGSAAAEVEARLKSGEVAVDRFREGFKNLAIIIGSEFQEGAKEAINGATAIENALQGAVTEGTFDQVFAAISAFAEQLGADLEIIAENLPEALELVDWNPFVKSIEELIQEAIGLFEAFFGDIDITNPEDLARVIQNIVDGITKLNEVTKGILEAFKPFIEKLGEIYRGFTNLDTSQAQAIGNLLGSAKIVNTITEYFKELSATIDLVGKMFVLIATGTTVSGAVAAFNLLATAVGSAGAALSALTGYGALFLASFYLGEYLRDQIPIFDSMNKSFTDSVLALRGIDMRSIEAMEAQAKLKEEMGRAAAQAAVLQVGLEKIPLEKKIDVALEDYFGTLDNLETMHAYVTSIPTEVVTKLEAEADKEQIYQEWNKIYEITEDGVLVELAVAGVSEAKKDVDDLLNEIPPEKQVELLLAFDKDIALAEIEATAEIAQAALKFKAEVDIAEIEAMTEIMVSSAEMLSDAFTSSGDVIIAAIGGLSDLGALAQLELFEVIEEEMRIRKQLAEQEIKLSDAQIAYLETRTAAMEKGEALINITMDGVYPELEMVMWKIIEQVQIKASEEGLEFLVGL